MNENIKLWEKNIPYYEPSFGDFVPSITIYMLENGRSNSCVLVIPGGGYSGRAEDHEGKQICEFLNSHGISAAILHYRVAPYSHPCMEEDARRAIRLLRFNAKKWKIDPEKIGVMGFSAGGHLTCMAALLFDDGKKDGDEIDKMSCRPNTAAPCYPVASFRTDITHKGTRCNFAGGDDRLSIADAYSPENLVREDAPPFFIWHTQEDNAVDHRCSLVLANALADKNVPYELHIFPYGKHGMGLARDNELASQWAELYVKWLHSYGF